MSIDVSGGLLEGVRVSDGNNGFTFPPRSIISDQSALDSIPGRAEYVFVADSLDPSKNNFEIADPDLRFRWTKNEGTVTRFRYNGYERRWLPSPGAPPDQLGSIGNDIRLVAPIPDETVSDAPFDLYVGDTVRLITFTVSFVGADVDFTNPTLLASGIVELSRTSGKLNFSQTDVDDFEGQTVLSRRQSFFDKTRNTGNIGSLPVSSSIDYFLFLNPKPASGQSPIFRIGYQRPLTPIQVANESLLGSPASGTFTWSVDTGRVRISTSDLSSNGGIDLYYDGVNLGAVQLTRVSLGSLLSSFPSSAFNIPSAVGLTDSNKYIIYAELTGQSRRYWTVSIQSSKPAPGTVSIDPLNGNLLFNASDVASFSSWTFFYTDSVVSVENGVSVQFFRSGVNGSGVAKVPDFVVRYVVENQIIVDGIIGSPFVMLPTTPIVDDDLVFSISSAPGSNGTFTGVLNDGTDPAESGLSYLLNLDIHQLNFANRKSISKTILRASPNLKLDDGAISSLGVEVLKNGTPITAGVDFNFDPDTGLIEFIEPVGVNEPGAVTDLSVSVTSVSGKLRGLQASTGTFNSTFVGKFALIKSGGNQGIYKITGFSDSSLITVSTDFATSGSVLVDIISQSETLADHFWTELSPPFKKFSISVSNGPNETFSVLDISQFNVFSNVGQVNLVTPALPGQIFQVAYVSLDSNDQFVTTPTNHVERALFRIRQETATVTVGTKKVFFNPDGKTVNTTRPIEAFLNGVPLDPEDFEFASPGTLNLPNVITAGQSLTLNYWVEEASGGETNFNLLFSPVDLDSPEITSGQQSTTFNGDQTGKILPGSALFIGQVEVLIVQESSYDSSNDVTNVTFESTPSVDSAGSAILVTEPVNASGFRINETSSVDILSKGTNVINIEGDVSSLYVAGTIVTVDSSPFSVLSSSYSPTTNKTGVTVSAPAKRNHIVPVLTRTIRPILFTSSSFQTKKPANVDFDFILVRMGSNREILTRGLDYDVSEGGLISLSSSIGSGDSLHALYVARTYQPSGTILTANYSYAIAPGSSNGLEGQRLLATYNLYAPDTFFYRVETVDTFLPEVQDLLRASASSGSSGPATQDAVGQANKDFGRPGPYFDEQHLGNIDFVIRRLLLFYNQLIDAYEDMLSCIDGRVVGGNQGRFRFDGLIDNPARDEYDKITNDIDDRIKLYSRLQLTGFFSFENVPVYGTMATPNSLSRIFPTSITKSAGLNSQVGVSAFGSPIGSLDTENIKSSSLIQSSKARSIFTKAIDSSEYIIPKNGDEELLIPRFVAGQDVDIYTLNGSLAGTGTVVSATTTEPATVIINFAVPLTEGSIMQNVSDAGNSLNHFYTPGRDLNIDLENGQITNSTVSLPGLQNPVIGNEIVDAFLILNNTNLRPKRFPALDGMALNDNGSVSEPPLLHPSEIRTLGKELQAQATLGNAKIQPDLATVSGSTIFAPALSVIQFLNGPNSGSVRTVSISLSFDSFLLSSPLPNADPLGSDFLITSVPENISALLNTEIGILSTNVSGLPISSGSQLLTVRSELKSTEFAITCIGDQVASGTGLTSGNVLTDGSADFTSAGVADGHMVFVQSGSNRGLYRVSSTTATTLSITTSLPWVTFPSSSSTGYVVLKRLDFLSEAHGEFLTKFYRDTLTFLSSTNSFLASLTNAGKSTRTSIVNARLSAIQVFLTQLESLLSDENLYEVRYLWIDQRANRQEGILTQKSQAILQRDKDLQEMVEDQTKLLIAEAL